MSRLPNRVSLQLSLQKIASCNPGLVYAKYPDEWENKPESSFSAKGEEKKTFFENFIELMKIQKGETGERLLRNLHERRQVLFDSLSNDQDWLVCDSPLKMKTDWRFVSGLGVPHPYETGLVFDHTYGVPYLPGSSVKGAARAWAEENGWSYEKCEVIFGPDEDAPNRDKQKKFAPGRGYVVFFDAYPTNWPELELDIINPHYSEYYLGVPNVPPADWLSPIPTYFLAVKPNQEWQFVVGVPPIPGKLEEEVLKKAGLENRDKLPEHAVSAVTGAAQDLGMGGKTAVGYGYFTAAADSASDKKTG